MYAVGTFHISVTPSPHAHIEVKGHLGVGSQLPCKGTYPLGPFAVGRLQYPADSRMFDMDNRPTIVKTVAESADSGIESADSTTNPASNPLRIGLWVWALIYFCYLELTLITFLNIGTMQSFLRLPTACGHISLKDADDIAASSKVLKSYA